MNSDRQDLSRLESTVVVLEVMIVGAWEYLLGMTRTVQVGWR